MNNTPLTGKRKRDQTFAPPNTPNVDHEHRLHNHHDDDIHQPKRSRQSPSPAQSERTVRKSLPWSSRKSRRAQRTTSQHASRFIEGSMNDRVSTKPPSIFTREEEAMDAYMDEPCTLREALGDPPSKASTVDDPNTSNDRASGMYRFGRAFLNALKPRPFWNDGKSLQVPEDSRKIAAERAWAELKANDFEGCKSTSLLHINEVNSQLSSRERKSIQGAAPINAYFTADASTCNGQSSNDCQQHDTSSAALPLDRSGTPSSIHRRRPTSLLRVPSLQIIHKASSYLQLPAKDNSLNTQHGGHDIPATPSSTNIPSSLRKEPSRKELAKHQKLSKRVSDLEAQLEDAKKQLRLSSASPVPPKAPTQTPVHVRRKAFVPGLLPSLPSERLINEKFASLPAHTGSTIRHTQATNEPIALHEHLVEAYVPSTPKSKVDSSATLEAASQLERELIDSLQSHSSARKRKSDQKQPVITGNIIKTETPDTLPTIKRQKSLRPAEKPRRAKLVEAPSSPLHGEPAVPPLPVGDTPSTKSKLLPSDSQSRPSTLAPPRRSPSKGTSRSILKSPSNLAGSKSSSSTASQIYNMRSPLGTLSASNINILPPVLETSSTAGDGPVKRLQPQTPKRTTSTPVIPKEDFEWPEDVF